MTPASCLLLAALWCRRRRSRGARGSAAGDCLDGWEASAAPTAFPQVGALGAGARPASPAVKDRVQARCGAEGINGGAPRTIAAPGTGSRGVRGGILSVALLLRNAAHDSASRSRKRPLEPDAAVATATSLSHYRELRQLPEHMPINYFPELVGVARRRPTLPPPPCARARAHLQHRPPAGVPEPAHPPPTRAREWAFPVSLLSTLCADQHYPGCCSVRIPATTRPRRGWPQTPANR